LIAHQGDVDHCFGYVDASLVASRQYIESWLAVDAPDDLDDEALECRLVHQLAPIVGAIGEEVLDPGPALADRMQDDLRAGAIGDVRRRQVDHQKPPVSVDRDVALAADDLFGRVVAPLLGGRRLHRLAVDHARRRASHSSSVRSDGYRFVFFSISAIRPRFARVHIPSLNHASSPRTIHSQTVS